KIQTAIRKKLKLKGLVLKDVNVIRSMDDQVSGWSDVLPVGISKDDSIYSNSSVLGEEEFLGLLNHIRKLIKEIGLDMLEGNIRIAPTKKGNDTACKYCPYDGICQFDYQLEDNGYRIIPRLQTEDVIQRIQQEKGEE
ncbi:MAG: ATP-dependent helicase/deoxyribonuclease subunit B, partial [Clostridiales bacterium]|nr:ATP-dependent helicase/deoxyribonuclease subunit B [Clostridiales bacterium]